ncbi:hypothetical protein KIN20_023117 [Parelaphostrongylus tenuis]|uniref:7TM GPCR serpentine receptor class x (Srx) domain-containing protein n=1 Tax=Parelaphostrongylus tenuis TaxID=148309 RepID=A0AAD5QV73_PARTN|nr:hypothetical protein KIN20_023117 [Parelaphostrongylus tenuis]
MASFTTTISNIHAENTAVSIMIATVGALGLVTNSAAVLAVRCNPALRSSFGLLCFSHCIANLSVLLIAVFWVAPTTLL